MSGATNQQQVQNGGVGAMNAGSLMTAHSAWANSWKTLPPDDDGKSNDKSNDDVQIDFNAMLDPGEDPGIHGDYSPNILVANLPLIGRVHLLKHKSGFATVGFIVLYWIYGTWSTIWVILKPHYDDGQIPGVLLLCILSNFVRIVFTGDLKTNAYYAVVSILCISALFRAVTSNPGRLPFSREPAVSPEKMTDHHCGVCRRRRPQRSHHCRRCGQCILKMDHHCPWINNCVGQENHWMFMQLLWYAFLMGASTFSFCMCHIYYWPPCTSCNSEAYTMLHFRKLLITCIVVSALMSVFAGMLGLQHVFSTWLLTMEMALSLSIGLALGMMGGSFGLLSLQSFSMTRWWYKLYYNSSTVRQYLLVLTIGLAVAMTATAHSLIAAHLLGIKTDMTTIDWMQLQSRLTAKGKYQFKDMPTAKKSCLQAHDDLCGYGSRLMWPFPCRRRKGSLYVTYPHVI